MDFRSKLPHSGIEFSRLTLGLARPLPTEVFYLSKLFLEPSATEFGRSPTWSASNEQELSFIDVSIEEPSEDIFARLSRFSNGYCNFSSASAEGRFSMVCALNRSLFTDMKPWLSAPSLRFGGVLFLISELSYLSVLASLFY